MECPEYGIEALFEKKYKLYQTLFGVLEQEKQCLTDADVAALWSFSEKKQAIVHLRRVLLLQPTFPGAKEELDQALTG